MIITEKYNTKTIGVNENKSFSIAASSKAFQILSSGLYSRKIEAFVRELLCNAKDAHIENNNIEKAVDIHIPTQLNSIFSIRDYGPGLSKDDVLTLYTTYFESTKNMSNDYIGAMGLGSKSPFAYTDSFTVTSYHNKRKTTYICYIDDSNLPNITISSEIDSLEPTGLQIDVAINNIYEDIEDVKYSLKKIIPFLDIKTNFLNDDEFADDIEKNTVCIYDCNLFKIVNAVHLRDTHYAEMGGVLYPIDFDECEATRIFSRYDGNYELSIIIKFKIGELDVAASREELQYTKSTREIINLKLKSVKKLKLKYIKHLKREINNVNDFMMLTELGCGNVKPTNKFIKYRKLYNVFSLTREFNEYKFNGNEKILINKERNIFKYYSKINTLSDFTSCLEKSIKIYRSIKQDNVLALKLVKIPNILDLILDGNKVYVTDHKIGTHTRLLKGLVIYEKYDNYDANPIYLLEANDKLIKLIKELFDVTSNNFTDVDDIGKEVLKYIPKRLKVTTSNQFITKDYGKIYNTYNFDYEYAEESDMDDTGIYVKTYRNKFEIKGKHYRYDEVFRILNYNGIDSIHVMTRNRNFNKLTNKKPIDDFFDEYVENFKDEYLKYTIFSEVCSYVNSCKNFAICKLYTSTFKDKIEHIKESLKLYPKLKRFLTLTGILEYSIDSMRYNYIIDCLIPDTYDLREKYMELFKKYLNDDFKKLHPIVQKLINRYYGYDTILTIDEFIELERKLK